MASSDTGIQKAHYTSDRSRLPSMHGQIQRPSSHHSGITAQLPTCSRKVLTVVSRRDSSFSCSNRISSYTPCSLIISTWCGTKEHVQVCFYSPGWPSGQTNKGPSGNRWFQKLNFLCWGKTLAGCRLNFTLMSAAVYAGL